MIFNTYIGENLPYHPQQEKKKKVPIFARSRSQGRGDKNVGDRVLILRTGETRIDTIKFVCVCCENP